MKLTPTFFFILDGFVSQTLSAAKPWNITTFFAKGCFADKNVPTDVKIVWQSCEGNRKPPNCGSASVQATKCSVIIIATTSNAIWTNCVAMTRMRSLMATPPKRLMTCKILLQQNLKKLTIAKTKLMLIKICQRAAA